MLYDRYRHSASAANMFLESPSAFVWRYGFRNWGEGNARMNMGNAAEFATHAALMQDMGDDAAAELAVSHYDGLMDGEVAEEREAVGEIVKQFLVHLRPLGKPLTYQAWKIINGACFGLRYDIKVKTDFGYGDKYIDTKATMRCPSQPKPSDIRQQALYATLLERPCSLLYATPKKFAAFPVEESDVAKGFREIVAIFRQIEALDDLCEAPEDAVKILPLNADSFYWDAGAVEKAMEVWHAPQA